MNDDLHHGAPVMICTQLAVLVAFPLLYTLEGLRMKHRTKQVIIFMMTLSSCFVTIRYLLFGPFPEYEDVVLNIPTLNIEILIE